MMMVKAALATMGVIFSGLLGLFATIWLILALIHGQPTGNYYVKQSEGNSYVLEDVRFGEDRVYYKGDEDRALEVWVNLPKAKPKPAAEPSPDLIQL